MTGMTNLKIPIFFWRRVFSWGAQRPGCEVDHSPPPRAEVKKEWSYTAAFSIRFHSYESDCLTFCMAKPSVHVNRFQSWLPSSWKLCTLVDGERSFAWKFCFHLQGLNRYGEDTDITLLYVSSPLYCRFDWRSIITMWLNTRCRRVTTNMAAGPSGL